ncbi:MAG TPA: hypothetical protein VFH68_02140 [Polyangia bacterium]|nr:hypothetical protein [Polyangia bacterium]
MKVVTHRTVVIESLVAGAIVLAAMLVLSPSDAGARRAGPHLAWIAVFLLAARYGTKGLAISLPLSAAIVVVSAAYLGQTPALWARVDGSADLTALVAAVLVAWVASTHENRRGEMARELDLAKDQSRTDRRTAREMQEALVALRSRADRMNLSLTFLRSVAERLERRDPEEAASAALVLAMTCLEARAGVVELAGPRSSAGSSAGSGARSGAGSGAGSRARSGANRAGPASLLSWVGPWNGDGSSPVLSGDRVVATALESGLPVMAAAVADAGPGDADMAAPLLDPRGRVFGVLAVRGLPHRAAGTIALRDLAVASAWLANVLNQPREGKGAQSRELSAALARGATGDHDNHPYLDLLLSYDVVVQPRIAAEVRA